MPSGTTDINKRAVIFNVLLLVLGSWLIYYNWSMPVNVPKAFEMFFAESETQNIPDWILILLGIFFIIFGLLGFFSFFFQGETFQSWFSCLSWMLLLFGCGLLITADIVQGSTRHEIDYRLRHSEDLYYSGPSQLRNNSIVAFDQLQSSFQCCGSIRYSEWYHAAGSPSNYGFIPVSCCRNGTDVTCTNNITRDDYLEPWFVQQFIYVDGCVPTVLGSYGTVVSIITYLLLTIIGLFLLIHCFGCDLYCPCLRRGDYWEI